MKITEEYQCTFCAEIQTMTTYNHPFKLDSALLGGLPRGWTFISPYMYVCPAHEVIVRSTAEEEHDEIISPAH